MQLVLAKMLILLFLCKELPEYSLSLSTLKPEDFFREGGLNPRQLPLGVTFFLHLHHLVQVVAKHTCSEYLNLLCTED